MENEYFKVIVRDLETGETEESNRVIDLNGFIKSYNVEYFVFEVTKLSDEEFKETEK